MYLLIGGASGGKNDAILRRQGINSGRVILDQKIGPQTLSTQVGFESLLRYLFDSVRLRSEVYSD